MIESQQKTPTPTSKTPQPLQSVQGWIIIATNIDPEIMEDDVFDAFSNYGEVKNLNLNLDRKTGMTKGYCLIEYGKYEEAEEAIKKMNGNRINQRPLRVDWAFKSGPIGEARK